MTTTKKRGNPQPGRRGNSGRKPGRKVTKAITIRVDGPRFAAYCAANGGKPPGVGWVRPALDAAANYSPRA